MSLKAALEGILFVVGSDGITLKELSNILDINIEELNKLIDELKTDYSDINRGINIELYGESIKLVTKREHSKYYQNLVEMDYNDNIGQSALEVLAIIAYNPNITRLKIDEIRGVSSSYTIRKLLVKGLIKENGKADLPGKPNLYTVTDSFLDFLGISSKDELPYVEPVDIVKNDKNLFESKYKEE